MLLKHINLHNTLLLILSVAIINVGCSDNSSDRDPSLTGSWLGTATVEGSTLTVNVQLNENNGAVNGNGVMTLIDPVAVNITGTYNFPSVSMTIRSSGLADLNFNGNLSAGGNSLTGSMSGSGFDNFSITLQRQ
jgi:hypothetical protein